MIIKPKEGRGSILCPAREDRKFKDPEAGCARHTRTLPAGVVWHKEGRSDWRPITEGPVGLLEEAGLSLQLMFPRKMRQ